MEKTERLSDLPPGPDWQVPSSWALLTKSADYPQLSKTLNADPVIVRILRNRGLESAGEMEYFLKADLKDMHGPELLPDVKRAAEILKEKCEGRKRIRIIGDYDVDGIAASFVLWRSLTFLFPDNAENISVSIPDRIKDGYGLNEGLIKEAAVDGVDTILTCDNGIAAAAETELAKELGMTVVVTDHHEVPFSQSEADGGTVQILPAADAVVDPKRSDSAYPFDGICGAVVAFKLCQVMAGYSNERLCEASHQKSPEGIDGLFNELTQICMLATVCDVMELVDENRPLVKAGLLLMQDTQNAGLRALIREKEIDPKSLKAYHMGFIIGPCLNASGRLLTAMKGFELLCEKDEKKAAGLAAELNGLNEERKQMTLDAVEEAVRLIEHSGMKPEKVIAVYLKDCHESIAGIVAGRLRERYNRPAFVVTRASEEGVIKGSGRSVPAYHMFRALHEAGDLLLKYGGHAMAAGFSLKEEDFEAFREKLIQSCTLTDADLALKTYIDADMPFSYITPALIDELDRLEPFGTGNSKPVFGLTDLTVCGRVRLMGKNENVAGVTLMDRSGTRMPAVCFTDAASFAKCADESGKINALYYPKINSYQGRETLQVVISEYKGR